MVVASRLPGCGSVRGFRRQLFGNPEGNADHDEEAQHPDGRSAGMAQPVADHG